MWFSTSKRIRERDSEVCYYGLRKSLETPDGFSQLMYTYEKNKNIGSWIILL